MPEKHMHEFRNKDLRLDHFAFIKRFVFQILGVPDSDFILKEEETSPDLQNYTYKLHWHQYFATTGIIVLKYFLHLSFM